MESGYKKVPYTELTTTADTEADNESSTGEGAASPGTGHAVNATDGVITSYYHSCYSGDNQPNREDGALTGNNTITERAEHPGDYLSSEAGRVWKRNSDRI